MWLIFEAGHKYAWCVYNKGGRLGLQQSSFSLRVFLNFSLLFQGRAKTGVLGVIDGGLNIVSPSMPQLVF